MKVGRVTPLRAAPFTLPFEASKIMNAHPIEKLNWPTYRITEDDSPLIDALTDAAVAFQRMINCSLDDLSLEQQRSLRWQMHPRTSDRLRRTLVFQSKFSIHDGLDRFRGIEIEKVYSLPENEVRLVLSMGKTFTATKS